MQVTHQVNPTNADNFVKTGSDTQTKPVRQKDNRSKREIICHGCGKPGHIRPNALSVFERFSLFFCVR